MNNLNGSEKQIEWATKIKANMGFDSVKETFKGNEAAEKVISFIENIESCQFWIDYKEYKAMDLLQSILKSGLATKGLEFSELTVADQNGNITASVRL